MRLPIHTIALALSLAAASQAQILYGFTRTSVGELAPTTLNTFDPATGALLTSIGPTGQGQLTAAATDPTTGQVYATHGGGGCCPVSGVAGCLLGADLTTGVVSTVGCDPIFQGNDNIAGLTVDSAGNVYGMLNWQNSPGANGQMNLVRIDKTSGVLTVLGATSGWCNGNGLEFGPGDVLYFSNGCDPWGTVDTTTGAFTAVGMSSFAGFPLGGGPVTDMAYDDITGTMYAAVADGGGGGQTTLATVDLATGTFTYVGDLINFTNSITFQGVPCADTILPSIPSLSVMDDMALATQDRVPDCGICLSDVELIFQYRAPLTGPYDIDLCGSPGFFDPTMAIYDSNPCAGPAVPILCNDDFCGLESGVAGLPLVGGSTYWIVVEELCGTFTPGPFQLNINFVGVPPCVDVVLPSMPTVSVMDDLSLSPFDRVSDCIGCPSTVERIFEYTAPFVGPYDIDMCGSPGSFDPTMAIYDVDPCIGPAMPLVCNDDLCGLESGVAGLPLAAGVTYYIVIEELCGGSGGPFQLDINFVGVLPCADIILPSMPSVSVADDVSISTLDRVPDCWCGSSIFERIIEYTAPSTGPYDIDLCSSPGVFDPTMAVYDVNPCLGPAVPIVCNDDFCGLQSGAAGVPLVGGTTYWIVVDQLCGGPGGPYVLDIDLQVACLSCGDCNEDLTVANIVDALYAARISVGLLLPNPNQQVCCDVDSSLSIDTLDVLTIAQFDAGLMVPLVCP